MNASLASSVVETGAKHQFRADGFAILPQAVAPADCDALAKELSSLLDQRQSSARRARVGLRNVLRASPLAARVAKSSQLLRLIGDLTGAHAHPVRAIFFDKTPDANWSVPWHQDLAIAVAERVEQPGFGPWSVKEGVAHVQPPLHILGEMIVIRLHLDECAADNGALRVIPGSHSRGELDTEAITRWTATQPAVVCEVPKGGALLMRPLLLHASSAAVRPAHRRVLHIEYAATELPPGLTWFEWT